MQMPLHQRVARIGGAVVFGLLALGSLLDAVSNAFTLITPETTYFGTALLLVLLGFIVVVLRLHPMRWVVKSGAEIRVKRVGAAVLAAFGGMVGLLWIPRVAGRSEAVLPAAPSQQVSEPNNKVAPVDALMRTSGVDINRPSRQPIDDEQHAQSTTYPLRDVTPSSGSDAPAEPPTQRLHSASSSQAEAIVEPAPDESSVDGIAAQATTSEEQTAPGALLVLEPRRTITGKVNVTIKTRAYGTRLRYTEFLRQQMENRQVTFVNTAINAALWQWGDPALNRAFKMDCAADVLVEDGLKAIEVGVRLDCDLSVEGAPSVAVNGRAAKQYPRPAWGTPIETLREQIIARVAETYGEAAEKLFQQQDVRLAFTQ